MAEGSSSLVLNYPDRGLLSHQLEPLSAFLSETLLRTNVDRKIKISHTPETVLHLQTHTHTHRQRQKQRQPQYNQGYIMSMTNK